MDAFLIATTVLYGLAIFNSLQILIRRQTIAAASAWIILNLLLPVVGVPLYYLVGNNRLPRYTRKKLNRDKAFLSRHAATESVPTPPSASATCDAEMVEQFHTMFGRYGTIYQPSAARTELLIDGEITFDKIFEGIASAKNYVLVQYYILRSDRLGMELQRLLIEKAKEGVKVYLLYDDMGSFWLPRKYLKPLKKAGVTVSRFLPVTSWSRAFQINFRNHRKLVIVDGATAFTGGLNFGDEYIGKSKHHGFWRDTHMKLEGPAVGLLEEVFLEDWFFANKTELELPSPAPQALFQDKDLSTVQVIPMGPTDRELIALYLLMAVVQAAEKTLWIATPYLVPDAFLQKAVEVASLKGLDVRILIPRKGDNRVVHVATQYYAHLLGQIGCKIYYYDKGYMHQKVMLVDNKISIIGSSNFDHRGIYLNFETAIVNFDQCFNSKVKSMLENDFENASPKKNLNSFRDLPIHHRLLYGLVRIVAPLF